jgi:hypothetical protein
MLVGIIRLYSGTNKFHHIADPKLYIMPRSDNYLNQKWKLPLTIYSRTFIKS